MSNQVNDNLDNSVTKNEYEERIEKQTEILKKAFKEIDRNNDDNIDQNELFTFLKSKGKDVNNDTLTKLFKTLDFQARALAGEGDGKLATQCLGSHDFKVFASRSCCSLKEPQAPMSKRHQQAPPASLTSTAGFVQPHRRRHCPDLQPPPTSHTHTP